jgi:hypothetical protein
MKYKASLPLVAALPLAIALSTSTTQTASAYNEEFLKWQQQTMTSFQQYKDERDKAFTDFLKKQWKEVDTEDGEVRDKKPKPVDMPVAQPKPVVVEDLPVVQLPKQVIPPKVTAPKITTPKVKTPVVSAPTVTEPRTTEPKVTQVPIDKVALPEPTKPITEPTTSLLDKPIFDLFKPKAEEPTPKPVPEPKAETKPESKQPSFDIPSFEKPIIEKPIVEQPDPIVKEVPVVTEQPILPPVTKIEKPEPPKVSYSGKKYHFEFFGKDTVIYVDRKLGKRLSSTYNGKTIAEGWSDLSLGDYDPVLEQLEALSKEHNLGDWGRVQLVFALAKAMHPNSLNNQTFVSWFLLVKQDYQARLAYNQQGVYLLVPAQQSLYEVTFFTFSGKRFYAVSPDGKPRDLGRVFTYDGEYPRAIEPVNMKDPLAFKDEQNYKQRSFNFKYKKQTYTVDLNVNPSRVDYLASYPQMDIDQYFVSPVDMVTANDALDHFRPMLDGKSELEAVNLLLRFVQTSFEYQTDDQQFGFENYLFAEETLTMPASDCEDRSVLFAWLVRELLGLEVVGLDYPGHIAAAVAFSKHVPGDSINWQGKRFTITDPTYINANAGMTMPQVAGHQPKVVAIR